MFENGRSLVDGLPMYGRAEGVVGNLLSDTGLRARTFIATKVWTRGRKVSIPQMIRSKRLLNVEKINGP